MKLVTFEYNGETRIGALAGDDHVVDLTRVEPSLPKEMLGLLAGGQWDEFKALADRLRAGRLEG